MQISPDQMTMEADWVDVGVWEDMTEISKIKEMFGDQKEQIGAEIFTSLFRFHPKIKENPPSPALARLLSEMQETSAYARLHSTTASDEILSAGGTMALYPGLETRQRELLEEIQKAMDARAERELLEDLSSETPEEEIPPKIKEEIQKLQEEEAQAEARALEILESQDPMALKQGIVAALEQAEEKIENAESAVQGWGTGPGTLQQLLFDTSLANYLQQTKIKKILELAGRFRQVISAERAKAPLPPPDEVEIVIGNDPFKAVASELVLLADETTEDLFFQKVVTGGLLCYEMKGKEKLGKGPFVVCIDESGSMAGAPEEWAKALTLALATQARKEKRKFGAVAFGSASEIRNVWNPEIPEFVAWMSQFFNGGTDFESPLQVAVSMLIDAAPEGDIIFVTDGAANLKPEFLTKFFEQKKTLGFKVLGIQIGNYPLDSLKKFCDQVFRLNVSAGSQGIETVIEQIQ